MRTRVVLVAATAALTRLALASPSLAEEPLAHERVTPWGYEPTAPHLRLAVGAAGTLDGGIAPSMLPGALAFVDVARDAPSGWTPLLRFGVETTATASGDRRVTVSGGGWELDGSNQAYSRLSARLDACPLRGALHGIEAHLCGRYEAGLVHVTSLTQPNEIERWLALGSVLRLRIAFPTAAPSEHPGGFFDLEAALVAPLDRYEVTLLGHEVYRPPPLTVALAIGIGAYAL